MECDRLFILKPGFEDPAFPGKLFYCWHCALMEGILASFPELACRLEVHRVAFPRPRKDVVSLVGKANQSLPLLVLANGETSPHQNGLHNGMAFISDKHAIMRALVERHGFPEPHP